MQRTSYIRLTTIFQKQYCLTITSNKRSINKATQPSPPQDEEGVVGGVVLSHPRPKKGVKLQLLASKQIIFIIFFTI